MLECQLRIFLNSENSADGRGTVLAGPLRLAGADVTAPAVGAFAVVLAREGGAEVTLFRAAGYATVVVYLQKK